MGKIMLDKILNVIYIDNKIVHMVRKNITRTYRL
mgnify:CR=1 FL=1